MAKELYLYSPIYSFVAEGLISQIEDNMGNEVTIRVNTPGGGVFNSLGIYAKMVEHGNVTVKVDGSAMSGGAFLLAYAKKVEALDTSVFMFHRADIYVESDSDKALLAKVNKDLRTKLEARVTDELFKEVTGYSYDEMFAIDKRIDIYLDSKQLKKLGLVQKINKLEPAEVEAFNSRMAEVASFSNENLNTNIKMTPEEIKLKYPEAYKAIVKEGIDKERDRVGAWASFASIDPAGVESAIKEGKEMNMTVMAEMALKKLNPDALKKIEAESPKTVQTDATDKGQEDGKQKNVEAFVAALDKNLGLVK